MWREDDVKLVAALAVAEGRCCYRTFAVDLSELTSFSRVSLSEDEYTLVMLRNLRLIDVYNYLELLLRFESFRPDISRSR